MGKPFKIHTVRVTQKRYFLNHASFLFPHLRTVRLRVSNIDSGIALNEVAPTGRIGALSIAPSLMPQRRAIEHLPALPPIRQVLIHQLGKPLSVIALQQVQ